MYFHVTGRYNILKNVEVRFGRRQLSTVRVNVNMLYVKEPDKGTDTKMWWKQNQ